MRKSIITLVIALVSVFGAFANSNRQQAYTEHEFEQAVQLIKKYETLHSPQHWPLIGYGHMVQPGEKYRKGQKLTEQQADALLRKDLPTSTAHTAKIRCYSECWPTMWAREESTNPLWSGF